MSKLYHIGISPEQGAKHVLLPGDPGRVEHIASFLERSEFVSTNREYTIFRGYIGDEAVLVSSTGMGGPSTAIGVEELYMCGVRNFIRVGTCGGMQQHVMGDDVVIASGAIRMEGTSREYAPIEYPAVSDFELTSALVQAAGELKYPYHVGVVQSKDSFYGQHSPQRMPVGTTLLQNWDAWIKCGCLASEMECAALFTVCSILRARAATALHVVWNQEREKAGHENPSFHDTSKAIKTAVEGLRIFIEREKAKQL